MSPPVSNALLSQNHDGSIDAPVADMPAGHASPAEESPSASYARAYKEQAHGLNSRLRRSGRWTLAGDGFALGFALLFGSLIARGIDALFFPSGQAGFDHRSALISFLGLGALALLWLDSRGHYRQRLPFWEATGHIVSVSLGGFCVCGFLAFVAGSDFSRLGLGLSWISFGGFLMLGRAVVRRQLMRRGQWDIPSLLIGEGAVADSLQRALGREPYIGFKIVRQLPAAVLKQCKKPNSWQKLMAQHGATHVILALEGAQIDRERKALSALTRERVPCTVVPPWSELPASSLSAHHLPMHDILLLQDTNRLTLPLPCFLKRSFDIAVSGTALLLLSPVFLFIAWQVRKDGGPAFFMQNRVGRHSALFSCYKFRSMRIDSEAFLEKYLREHPEHAAEWEQFQKLKNDVRITRVGAFIRKTSLDELPQLINVFKGDMSLVGPRPIIPGQESYYEEDFVYYESVRPGITGPWQVSGRNQLTFKERVVLEACYARNWSLWMDIAILFKTLPALLKKEQAF